MPWQNNSGGPWGGGGGDGPGGRGPWGGGGGGGGGNRPPDIDDLLRQGREKLKVIIGGGGGGRGGPPGIPPLGKKGVAAIVAGLFAVWVFASLYTVRPEEQSVELLFGSYHATREPGLRFAPWPFITKEIRAVSRENIIDIGYGGARARGRDADSGLMLTGDENIVDIDFQVVWNIADLPKFLFNLASPEETIRAVSESAMREIIGRSQLAPILNRDRALVSQEVLALIRQTLDSYDSGVNVLRVNFDRADPPSQVIDAFRDVQAAGQDRNTQESQAEAYANRALAEARGSAAQLLQEAEAYRAQTVNEASGEAARFKAIHEEYKLAPDVTRQRLYLETMERVLGGVNKVVIDEGAGGQQGVVPFLPLNEIGRRAQP
jgi:membrane protease subunit HflK